MPIRTIASSLVVLLSLVVASSAWAQQRVRVGGDIKEPKKIRDVKPVYPEDAKAAGVQGIVIIEAIIGTDGAVKEAKVIRSVAMLDAAALEAVIQWRYTPTLLNGEPVELVMTVTVTFTLSEQAAAATGGAVKGAGASSGAAGTTGPPARAVASGENPVYTFAVSPDVPAPTRPVRVGGDIKAPTRVAWVAPKFPEGQRSAARDGLIVILEVVIGPDGRVSEAKVLRAPPVIEATVDTQGKVTDARRVAQDAFATAALDAVRHWEYMPTLLNGVPVSIVMTVTVTFTTTSRNDTTCE